MRATRQIVLGMAGMFGGLGVIAGAFAAHALEDRLEPDDLNAFEIGVDYQLYHALALLALAALPPAYFEKRSIQTAAWSWFAGVVFFSGSLYGLAFTDWGWLGPVTPLGGLIMIVGWACVAVAAFTGGGSAD